MRRNNLIVLIAVLVALVCVLGLTACKSQPKGLVGTWSVSMGSAGSGSGLTWQFSPDGKFTQGGGTQSVPGTYSLSGDTLTLITTVNGNTATSPMTIKWVTNDQFTAVIGGMGGTLTVTRQK